MEITSDAFLTANEQSEANHEEILEESKPRGYLKQQQQQKKHQKFNSSNAMTIGTHPGLTCPAILSALALQSVAAVL